MRKVGPNVTTENAEGQMSHEDSGSKCACRRCSGDKFFMRRGGTSVTNGETEVENALFRPENQM